MRGAAGQTRAQRVWKGAWLAAWTSGHARGGFCLRSGGEPGVAAELAAKRRQASTTVDQVDDGETSRLHAYAYASSFPPSRLQRTTARRYGYRGYGGLLISSTDGRQSRVSTRPSPPRQSELCRRRAESQVLPHATSATRLTGTKGSGVGPARLARPLHLSPRIVPRQSI